MITADNLRPKVIEKDRYASMRTVKREPPPLTQEYVRSRLSYVDGKMYWKEDPHQSIQWNGRHVGKRAGTDETKRHRGQIRIDGRGMLVRRAVWIYHYGDIPKGMRVMKKNKAEGDAIENLYVGTAKYLLNRGK